MTEDIQLVDGNVTLPAVVHRPAQEGGMPGKFCTRDYERHAYVMGHWEEFFLPTQSFQLPLFGNWPIINVFCSSDCNAQSEVDPNSRCAR